MKLRDRKKRRSGSALLVVLGFLSFMVVSAVAFAIYMRAERVPSSALRRNVATRHLVKAALAQAMSRVDDAIRNDPFPGLANTNGNNYANFYHDKDNNSMDLWLGRVFMPPDPAGLLDDGRARVSGANEPGDRNRFPWRFAPVTETVSVLNLEALGYLPPPLVNDVRFLSRSSWTAKWQNFAFDAGRFAFCAVNVSDYFDINRTKVGVRSSPLDSRVSLRGTLSYSRPGENDTDNKPKIVMKDLSDSDIAAFSQLIGPNATRPTYSNPDGNAGSAAKATTEYVSLLDYNLAFGKQHSEDGIGQICNPSFYKYLKMGGDHFYYNAAFQSTLADGLNKAARQPFVTDSFSAASNNTYEIDFATLAGQPFSSINMNGNVTAQDVAMATGSQCVKRMYDKGLIGEADVFTLYDYLDHDDIPLSLAMPSVECVPMVTGVELVGNQWMQLKVIAPPTPAKTYTSQVPGPCTEIRISKYTLEPSSFNSAGAGVRVLVAFPFRHFRGRNIDGFKAQVIMKAFVAANGVSARPPSGSDLAALHPDKNEWNNQQSKEFTVNGQAPGDALAWSLYSDKVNISLPNECGEQKDALIKVDVTSWKGSANVPGAQTFFTTFESQTGTWRAAGPLGGGGFTSDGTPATYEHQFDLRPFDNAGKLMAQGKISGDISQAAYGTLPFQTYAMLWVRITDDSGEETYDLAPAVIDDDMLNNKNNNNAIFTQIMGSSGPGCLLFSGDQSGAYTYANMVSGNMAGLGGQPPVWTPKALAVVDPRFNYLPEDWFEWDESEIDGGKWLGKIAGTGYFIANDERDPDIFMFTSNQGYLQSIGEFAFLPRLSEWNRWPSGRISSLLQKGGGDGAKHADKPEAVLNNVCAWRTYPIIRELDAMANLHHTLYDDFARVGIGCSSDGVQTVNPYSDNEAVLMSAFAYTPCDYWTTGRIVAGAKSRGDKLSDGFQAIVTRMGDNNKTSGDDIGKASECLQHSFCEKNSDSSSQMKASSVAKIMRRFADAIRTDAGKVSWEMVYDKLFDDALADLDGDKTYTRTDDNASSFLGVNLGEDFPLYSIDRKFLYSYWRDCFANKQQLFLIFVRAESTALGGPGEGTPSQQGGRAVALVWREPTAYSDGSNPDNTYSDNIGQNDIRSKEFRIGRRPHRMRVLFYHQFD